MFSICCHSLVQFEVQCHDGIPCRGIANNNVCYLTLQSCWPWDNSSKGCLLKHLEQANRAVAWEAIIEVSFFYNLYLENILLSVESFTFSKITQKFHRYELKLKMLFFIFLCFSDGRVGKRTRIDLSSQSPQIGAWCGFSGTQPWWLGGRALVW